MRIFFISFQSDKLKLHRSRISIDHTGIHGAGSAENKADSNGALMLSWFGIETVNTSVSIRIMDFFQIRIDFQKFSIQIQCHNTNEKALLKMAVAQMLEIKLETKTMSEITY